MKIKFQIVSALYLFSLSCFSAESLAFGRAPSSDQAQRDPASVSESASALDRIIASLLRQNVRLKSRVAELEAQLKELREKQGNEFEFVGEVESVNRIFYVSCTEESTGCIPTPDFLVATIKINVKHVPVCNDGLCAVPAVIYSKLVNIEGNVSQQVMEQMHLLEKYRSDDHPVTAKFKGLKVSEDGNTLSKIQSIEIISVAVAD